MSLKSGLNKRSVLKRPRCFSEWPNHQDTLRRGDWQGHVAGQVDRAEARLDATDHSLAAFVHGPRDTTFDLITGFYTQLVGQGIGHHH